MSWFESQIDEHKLDPNKSKIAVDAIEFYFAEKRVARLEIPDRILDRVDEFVEKQSTSTTSSDVVIAAITDYLNRY